MPVLLALWNSTSVCGHIGSCGNADGLGTAKLGFTLSFLSFYAAKSEVCDPCEITVSLFLEKMIR